MTHGGYDVLILGYGEMGHAMEHLLGLAQRLHIWQRPTHGAPPPVDLGSAAAASDFVLFCLPAQPHRELATRVRPHLRERSVCMSIAKGVDDMGHTVAQVFAEVLGTDHAYALLYGPMISEELRAGRPGFAQVGTADRATYEKVRTLFEGTTLCLEHTDDVQGISWAAVLKNVYAILFGVADELALGDNMRGHLAVTATQELGQIVTRMGGRESTPSRLAGLGDLVTTATSAGSHHYELGRRLARAEAADMTGEGVHTLRMIHDRALLDIRACPLMRLVESCLADPPRTRGLMQAHLREHYR